MQMVSSYLIICKELQDILYDMGRRDELKGNQVKVLNSPAAVSNNYYELNTMSLM